MINDMISIKDIHTAAYLQYRGVELNFTKIGTRVVFEVPADDVSYRFLAEFQCNPVVPLLDYVNVLRRLRSRMLDVRDGTTNGNGTNGRRTANETFSK